ncbi:MAG: cobalt transporter [Xanthobacter sp. 17-67-6]|nr:MAG: cobalt transporter [Xanthobacter sp. 17-67-6]
MHIEPGLVDSGKIWLSYVTAAGAGGYAVKLAYEAIRERGILSLVSRSVVASALVFSFFEVLPHYPVGVSEVHLILGSTLFLIFGMAPAAIGLAAGLLVPLFALQVVAQKIIAPNTPYVELRYRQALALSTTYQAGIVGWVAFWALYGQGFAVDNIAAISTFGGAYMLVVIIEPLADLAVLGAAKALSRLRGSLLLERRLYEAV